MRPSEVDNDEIVAAGKALIAAGRNVTGFALRQRVGGGNATRLRQVWDEYLAIDAKPVEPVAELPVEVADEVAKISTELVERLQRLAIELNDKAIKSAERRVVEVVRSAGEQRQQAERELADASTTVDELERALLETREDNERLQGLLAEAQAAQQAKEVDFAKAMQRLEDEKLRVDQALAELAQAKESVLDAARLQGRLEALSEQNAQLLNRLESGKPAS